MARGHSKKIVFKGGGGQKPSNLCKNASVFEEGQRKKKKNKARRKISFQILEIGDGDPGNKGKI